MRIGHYVITLRTCSFPMMIGINNIKLLKLLHRRMRRKKKKEIIFHAISVLSINFMVN